MHIKKWYIGVELIALFLLLLFGGIGHGDGHGDEAVQTGTTAAGEDYIKWVDFNVSYEALCAAYD